MKRDYRDWCGVLPNAADKLMACMGRDPQFANTKDSGASRTFLRWTAGLFGLKTKGAEKWH